MRREGKGEREGERVRKVVQGERRKTKRKRDRLRRGIKRGVRKKTEEQGERMDGRRGNGRRKEDLERRKSHIERQRQLVRKEGRTKIEKYLILFSRELSVTHPHPHSQRHIKKNTYCAFYCTKREKISYSSPHFLSPVIGNLINL